MLWDEPCLWFENNQGQHYVQSQHAKPPLFAHSSLWQYIEGGSKLKCCRTGKYCSEFNILNI
jgi:hypothetical protein